MFESRSRTTCPSFALPAVSLRKWLSPFTLACCEPLWHSVQTWLPSTGSWFLLSFTRACFESLWQSEHGNHIVVVTPPICPRLFWISHHFDIQSTARQSHCVNTVWDHRNKERSEIFRPHMSSPDIHPPPPHDMQFACLSPSFLISVIPMLFLYHLHNPDTIDQFKT